MIGFRRFCQLFLSTAYVDNASSLLIAARARCPIFRFTKINAARVPELPRGPALISRLLGSTLISPEIPF